MITVPQLPPKRGYVEVVVDGEHVYRSITTGILLRDEVQEPTEAEDIASMMVDHEQRIIMLELGLSDTGTEDNNNVETSTATND